MITRVDYPRVVPAISGVVGTAIPAPLPATPLFQVGFKETAKRLEGSSLAGHHAKFLSKEDPPTTGHWIV